MVDYGVFKINYDNYFFLVRWCYCWFFFFWFIFLLNGLLNFDGLVDKGCMFRINFFFDFYMSYYVRIFDWCIIILSGIWMLLRICLKRLLLILLIRKYLNKMLLIILIRCWLECVVLRGSWVFMLKRKIVCIVSWLLGLYIFESYLMCILLKMLNMKFGYVSVLIVW